MTKSVTFQNHDFRWYFSILYQKWRLWHFFYTLVLLYNFSCSIHFFLVFDNDYQNVSHLRWKCHLVTDGHNKCQLSRSRFKGTISNFVIKMISFKTLVLLYNFTLYLTITLLLRWNCQLVTVDNKKFYLKKSRLKKNAILYQ